MCNFAIAGYAAITHVWGGVNLNCTFKLWAVFLHSYTVYRQLKFCVQSLIDELCKWIKFQVRFWHDQSYHSLVRPILCLLNMDYVYVRHRIVTYLSDLHCVFLWISLFLYKIQSSLAHNIGVCLLLRLYKSRWLMDRISCESFQVERIREITRIVMRELYLFPAT